MLVEEARRQVQKWVHDHHEVDPLEYQVRTVVQKKSAEQDGALIEAMARAGYGAVAIPDDDIEWDDLTDDDRALLICTFRAALAVARPVIARQQRDEDAKRYRTIVAHTPGPIEVYQRIWREIEESPLTEETS